MFSHKDLLGEQEGSEDESEGSNGGGDGRVRGGRHRVDIAEVAVTQTIFDRVGPGSFTSLGAVTAHRFIVVREVLEVRAAPLVYSTIDALYVTEVGTSPLRIIQGTSRNDHSAITARGLG